MSDNMKTQKGIGHYKVRYEMDVVGSNRDQHYIAGVIAYDSKEAIDTLVAFARKRVKGFKGLKVDEVAYEGGCHAISDAVRNAVLTAAINEGTVVSKEQYQLAIKEDESESKKEAKKATVKKSVIPKE